MAGVYERGVALVGVAAALAACSGEISRSMEPGPAATGSSTGMPGGGSSGSGESDPTMEPNTSTTGTDDSGSTGAADVPGQVVTVARPPGIVEGPDGSWTYDDNTAFYDIGKSFYADHPDDYDFLAVYTEGEIPYYYAQALTVRFDVGGIGYDGVPPWVQPSDVGSAGQLQQINVMNTPALYEDAPSAVDVLVHETAHRWAAFLELGGTPQQGYLLGPNFGHWNIHVDTGGPSATGYGELVDLGDGRFEFTNVWPLQLSKLELYLAGLIPPQEVPPLFYVESPSDYDPPQSYDGEWKHTAYGEDATFRGTRIDFTIDDLIAANGPRTPASGEAQTHFRFAFILVCNDPEACDPDQLAIVEAQRAAFVEGFAAATGDRASVSTTL